MSGSVSAASSALVGAVGGGYEDTEIGQVITSAYIEAYHDLVARMRNVDVGDTDAPQKAYNHDRRQFHVQGPVARQSAYGNCAPTRWFTQQGTGTSIFFEVEDDFRHCRLGVRRGYHIVTSLNITRQFLNSPQIDLIEDCWTSRNPVPNLDPKTMAARVIKGHQFCLRARGGPVEAAGRHSCEPGGSPLSLRTYTSRVESRC